MVIFGIEGRSRRGEDVERGDMGEEAGDITFSVEEGVELRVLAHELDKVAKSNIGAKFQSGTQIRERGESEGLIRGSCAVSFNGEECHAEWLIRFALCDELSHGQCQRVGVCEV